MASAYVKVYHGPCDTFDTVAHKPQKLKGLKDVFPYVELLATIKASVSTSWLTDRLQKRGFRVDFVPVDYHNYCMIEMCGHVVFRCNMKNLSFNTPFEMDPVCQRAVHAVEESAKKVSRARTYIWFWNLIEEEMFKRSKYAPVDTWPTPLHLETFASCLDCLKCCGILYSKKEPIEEQIKKVKLR